MILEVEEEAVPVKEAAVVAAEEAEEGVMQFVPRTSGIHFERPVRGLSNETRQRWERWLLRSVS